MHGLIGGGWLIPAAYHILAHQILIKYDISYNKSEKKKLKRIIFPDKIHIFSFVRIKDKGREESHDEVKHSRT